MDPEELTAKTALAKKRKMTTWIIRQLITASIVIPLMLWRPAWTWLLYVWIGLALTSLTVNLVMFRMLERKLDDLRAGGDSIDGEGTARGDGARK